MGSIMKRVIIIVALLGLAACGKSQASLSLGGVEVNGPSISGNVPVGTKRLYTLLNLHQNEFYTVRTQIATLGTGTTTPDGTLTVSIYSSESAYLSDPTTSVTVLTPATPNYPYLYEAYFQALAPGDYVAVIGGQSISVSNLQFFYDLRVMSADPNSPAAISSLTPFQGTTIPTQQAVAINPDNIQVYNGGILNPPGTHTLNLKSTVTSTGAYPQLLVYSDSTLKVESLLFSSITDSVNFNVTQFIGGVATPLPANPTNSIASGVTITGVPFTSGTTTGSPFIVVRGIFPNVYTLSVGL